MDRTRLVANNIKFYRQMNGLNCAELGRKIGCTGQWINKLETYLIAPPIDTCFILADLFGVTVYDLFWFNGQPEPAKKLALINEKRSTESPDTRETK